MSKVYDGITDRLAAWLLAQPMFVVATIAVEALGRTVVCPEALFPEPPVLVI